MRFPVFLDTNVLYPPSLADTLLRLSEAEVIRPHWSPDVMDELERNLAEVITAEKAHRRRVTMEAAFPDATVSGYESMIDSMANHRKDRHVLAAAVHSHCEVIVTFNLKDFPSSALAPHGITAVHPDDFLLDQLDLYPQSVGACWCDRPPRQHDRDLRCCRFSQVWSGSPCRVSPLKFGDAGRRLLRCHADSIGDRPRGRVPPVAGALPPPLGIRFEMDSQAGDGFRCNAAGTLGRMWTQPLD